MKGGLPILELTAFVADHKRRTGKFPEFIVLLPDNSVRTAAWGLGTILVGPYGTILRPEQWPKRWMPLPSLLELQNDQR